MPKYKLMVARFPYGGREDTECVDWLVDFFPRVVGDPRFEVVKWKVADTPITMTRNECLEVAKREGVDFVLMIDSDMAPDLYLGIEAGARPFFQSSVEFMIDHPGPCAVGAPYCGPPPHENVYVFEWQNFESGQPNRDLKLGQITREDAARRTGITEVAALPTGLYLLDVRALARIAPPYFAYEFEGDGEECPHCSLRTRGPQAKKISTEDVVFTRDLSLNGVKQYCNWDAWAGHVKRKVVGKPVLTGSDILSKKLRDAILAGVDTREKLVEWPPRGMPAAADRPNRMRAAFEVVDRDGGATRPLAPGGAVTPLTPPTPVDPFEWRPGLAPAGQDLPPAPAGLNGQE